MSINAATTEGSVSLSASTAKTLLQIRGASATKARVIAWAISFNGTTADNEPVLVRLLRQTTDGTGTAGSEVGFDPDSPAATLASYHDFSSEPTAGDVLEEIYVHPQGGLYLREYVPGREPVLDDATTSRLAIEANAPDAVAAVAWMQWEE